MGNGNSKSSGGGGASRRPAQRPSHTSSTNASNPALPSSRRVPVTGGAAPKTPASPRAPAAARPVESPTLDHAPSFAGNPNFASCRSQGGSFARLPEPSPSMPRYIDAKSLVYTVPAASQDRLGSFAFDDGPEISPIQSQTNSQSRFVPPSASGADMAGGGGAASPISMSSSRRMQSHMSSASLPIAIPTYNPHTAATDEVSSSSPMLKSYRQHSFCASGKEPRLTASTNSPVLTFSGSNPGAFSIGGSSSNVAGLVNSPPVLSTVSSSAPSGPSPIHARYLNITAYPLGLENFGNTCYCNSVIQLIYHCTPLRLRLLELHQLYTSKKGGVGFEENTLLYHLCSLIAVLHKSNNRRKDKRRELISPTSFMRCVREGNSTFNNNMQQDAHEFAMYILNGIIETEQKMMTDPKNRALFAEESSSKRGSSFYFWRSKSHNHSMTSSVAVPTSDGLPKVGSSSTAHTFADGEDQLTPLQAILQGQFGSLTACLECENITAREEVFLDLSLETKQGSSLLHCLNHFGDPEYFYGNNKLHCDRCNDRVRAAKTIHVEKLPQYALLVHLKRFQYDVSKQTFTKKADHVALPMEMDVEEYQTDASPSSSAMPPTSPDGAPENRDAFKKASDEVRAKLRGVARHKARFTLTGFVAHLGEGPNLGHYFTCVRYGPQLWRRFDDDVVTTISEREVMQCFGVPINVSGVVTSTAYILLRLQHSVADGLGPARPDANARSPARLGEATPARVFWSHSVRAVAPAELKKTHAYDRAVDRRARFTVRKQLREDGVRSNLYRLDPLPEATVFMYDMYAVRSTTPHLAAPPPLAKATRGTRKPRGDGTASAAAGDTALPRSGDGGERRVSARRAWHAVQRSLKKYMPSLAHVVQLEHTVFSVSPLPAAAMKVAPALQDLGWTACELRLVGQRALRDLDPSVLQQLTNKIVPHVVRHHNAAHRAFEVVRECNGKLVCTTGGIRSGGLRVFRGTIVQALWIDKAGEQTGVAAAARAPHSVTPSTRHLASTPVGVTPAEPSVRFTVSAFVRAFTFRGRHVESYKIADASGVYLASYWEPPSSPALTAGRTYVAGAVKVREFPERNHLRLFEFTHGSSTVVAAEDTSKPPDGSAPTTPAPPTAAGDGAPPADAPHGHLALKIDTKGTIASETSLWEEVTQHFGLGPYTAEAQRRITQSVQGTPVVISYSLRQGVIRLVRFHIDAEGGARADASGAVARADHVHPQLLQDLDPGLLPHLPKLDPGQPYAVLSDYSVLPLQVLHCCYDPRMKGWQDVAITVLSVMPQRRMEVLQQYQRLLAPGLLQWGLQLADLPSRTNRLSLLPIPQKSFARPYTPLSKLRHPPPAPFPSTLLILGIAGDGCTEDERAAVTLTAQQMAQYFKANLVTSVSSEAEAIRYMVEQLVLPAAGTGASAAAPLRDANSAAILILTDRGESRASRWVVAECLSRGVLPVVMPPAASPRRVSLLCGNAKRQISVKFSSDPLQGVSLRQEVPAIAQKRVLVVGVDTCHTSSSSIGSVVGILSTPQRNHLLSTFWKQEARGRETQHVAKHFCELLIKAAALYDGLDEVIIFQDGDVFSELSAINAEVSARLPSCGLTFMCLHKRSNIRFLHDAKGGRHNNLVKGVVIPALAPVPLAYDVVAPSFYLQTHESNMSTARTVQYTVHHVSPTLDVSEVQQIANVMANVLAPQATKLPMSTRCAHRLADQAERLLDAVPQLHSELIPSPLNQRLWFL